MDKNTLMARIAAIVSTLNEVDGAIESTLYMLCDMNMDDYQTIRRIITEAGFVTIKNHFVIITPKGRVIAAQIDSVLSKKGGR